MADFEYKDPDGDALQVVSMNYPGGSGTPGWLFRSIPRDGSRYRSVWLPAFVAAKLAETLQALGSSDTSETPLQVAESASIRWRVGEHTIEIEGRTAGEVADALRVALGDGTDTGLLDELAEMLDCDPAELLGELRQVIERRDEAEAKVTDLTDRTQGMLDDLRARPTTAQLQKAERAAAKVAADLKALQVSVVDDHNGIRELRRQLHAVGLQGMSTATLPEIAETIARLGAENSALREVNSRGGMADDLQRQTREQQQEIEALRQIDDQLQKAIERERDLRKAAEAGRDEWIERCRAESGATRLLQEHLGIEHRKVAELNGEVQRLTTNLADADREVQQAAESLRQLHAQLQWAEKAASEAVDSRAKAEEAYADCGRRNGELQGQLLAATAEAKLQATAAQKYLDMLRIARTALSSMRDQFTDEDGAPEACTLSVEMTVPLVDTIDETLAATA